MIIDKKDKRKKWSLKFKIDLKFKKKNVKKIRENLRALLLCTMPTSQDKRPMREQKAEQNATPT